MAREGNACLYDARSMEHLDPSAESALVAVIDAQGLIKDYGGQRAVDEVDVRVQPGECWGLLGPNGAGKTTFLRMVVGNTIPSAGRLRVLGRPVPDEAPTVRARIGVVPQADNLDPELTVTENLVTFACYFGIGAATARGRIEELLRFAELDGRADAPLSTLSGGMLRRLSLVRALINEPELLILDEPTTGLDPQARQLIWQRLRSLKRHGLTLILTTHYMEEAERLCDRVTVMDHGTLLDTASPRELIARHIEPQVVEVHGPELETWHKIVGHQLALRSEQVGETQFYYVDDERALLEALHGRRELSYLHRRSNLEDVFIKLTGRELRDG
jgi:lipooligosaccharide transport system ATP-binding protein